MLSKPQNGIFYEMLKPCKVQRTYELKPLDYLIHRSFANWIREQSAGFSQNIIFSDEAHGK